MSRVVTIVLAAGAGKRLGGPKALLAWPAEKGPDRPLAIAHAEARLGAESDRVLVICRPALIGALLRYVRPGIDLLASDAPEALGAAGSIAFACARLGDAETVVASPVDTPPTREETMARLIARLASDPALLAVRPIYHGRRGHPAVLRRAALGRYAEPAPPPLREHLRGLGAACADVEVADPAVLIDLDKPADVMGWLRSLPRFLG